MSEFLTQKHEGDVIKYRSNSCFVKEIKRNANPFNIDILLVTPFCEEWVLDINYIMYRNCVKRHTELLPPTNTERCPRCGKPL